MSALQISILFWAAYAAIAYVGGLIGYGLDLRAELLAGKSTTDAKHNARIEALLWWLWPFALALWLPMFAVQSVVKLMAYPHRRLAQQIIARYQPTTPDAFEQKPITQESTVAPPKADKGRLFGNTHGDVARWRDRGTHIEVRDYPVTDWWSDAEGRFFCRGRFLKIPPV